MTNRAHWIRFIVGGRGDDNLEGTAGRDVILGRDGADVLDGGAGNDILIGDGVYWSWNHCYWGKPRGSHDDTLDGGAGSDLLFAGRGDDLANYTLSENIGAHDVYDGGTGFDTLQLTLTHAEMQLSSVQDDIAAFKAFLECKANPWSDDGRTFEFKSFNLDVRDFEALEILLVGGNTAPVAQNDSYPLDEDKVLLISGPGVAGNDADPEGSALSVTLVAGPAHGALVLNANGSFSYTPEANFDGADSFTYKVDDGDLDSNVATVALQVAPKNDDPVAVNDAATTDEDMQVVVSVLANDTDVDGDSLFPVLVLGPAHGTLGLNGDGSITYTPYANFNGTDSFTYVANDGSTDSDEATVSLMINSVNDAPDALGDTNSTDEATPVDGNVLANDTDADTVNVLTINAVNGEQINVGIALLLASGALLTFDADGSYRYDPNGAFETLGAGASADDGFAYMVTDGHGGFDTAAVAITVAGVNDGPAANVDSASTDEDHGVPIDVLANDSDVDARDTLSIVAASVTSGVGFATIVGDQVEYAPGADYQYLGAGESAEVSIAYTVADSLGAESSSVASLTVTGVNDVPTAVDDPIATDEDTPAGGNVLANDTDADASDLLTISEVNGQSSSVGVQIALASGALLTVNADGSVAYDPNGKFETLGADESAIEIFTYVATDPHGEFAPATATITVAGVNDAPVANDDEIPSQALAGDAIRVAVIGGNSGGYVAAAAQLRDSTAFSIVADAVPTTAFTTGAQWKALLQNYDAVVLGDGGFRLDYGATPLFSALRDFVDAGGGVVTTGWFAAILSALPEEDEVREDADYITPISQQDFQFALNGSTITILDTAHPIADGVTSYRVTAIAQELAGGVDAGATVLASGIGNSGAPAPALVVAEVGKGLTAYFGSPQMAGESYSPDRVAGGTVDQIFERVVAWAADAQDVFAATDEDTPLTIDAAALLANDLDSENDAVAISGVSATSVLGATVSIGAAGSIVYDPTAALQYLQPGQVVTDSFDYAVVDGHGDVGIGTVSLTVAGRADADSLL